MPTLTETIKLPGGVDPSTVRTTVELWGAGAAITGFEQTGDVAIGGPRVVTGNPWTVTNLVGNADIELPAGTVYRCTRQWPGLKKPLVDYIVMPTTAGTYQLGDILAEQPASLPSAALTAHAADTALHGGGRELVYVEASNTSDLVVSTAGVQTLVPGLQASLVVPSRPFVVRWAGNGYISATGVSASLSLHVDGSSLPVQVGAGNIVARAAVTNDGVNFLGEARFPSAYYQFVAGSSHNFEIRLTLGEAGSVTLRLANLGGFGQFGAYLMAVTQ